MTRFDTTDTVVERWVQRQLLPWQSARLKADDLEREYARLNRLFRFCVIDVHDDGTTTMREKEPLPQGQIPEAAAAMLLTRRQLYYALIDSAVRERHVRVNVSIGLDFMDITPTRPSLPMFCFQKSQSSHNILLPDIDLLLNNWYSAPITEECFGNKLDSAIFVGSSTGWSMSLRPLTPVDVEYNLNPRLHLAGVLDGHPTIEFKIASAVQCANDDARRRLEAKPYFSEFVPLESQLKHKFILSTDGNGATCSRVALALRSKSVLVKFWSPHRLLYFDELVAGTHFLPVNSISDVEDIIRQEIMWPGSFAGITEHANRFFSDYLCREFMLSYVARLVDTFARLIR